MKATRHYLRVLQGKRGTVHQFKNKLTCHAKEKKRSGYKNIFIAIWGGFIDFVFINGKRCVPLQGWMQFWKENGDP